MIYMCLGYIGSLILLMLNMFFIFLGVISFSCGVFFFDCFLCIGNFICNLWNEVIVKVWENMFKMMLVRILYFYLMGIRVLGDWILV